MFKKKTINDIDILNLLQKMENKIDILQSNSGNDNCIDSNDNDNLSKKIDQLIKYNVNIDNKEIKNLSCKIDELKLHGTDKDEIKKLSLKIDELKMRNGNGTDTDEIKKLSLKIDELKLYNENGSENGSNNEEIKKLSLKIDELKQDEIKNVSLKIDELIKSQSFNAKVDIDNQMKYVSLKLDELTKNTNFDGEYFKRILDQKMSDDKINKLAENLTNKLLNNLQTTETIELIKKCDGNLRKDLHQFILGIKDEIIKSTIEHINDIKINEKLNNIDNKVSQFFYDNEIIKQQLSIENDLRKYMDEIDDINETVNKIKNYLLQKNLI